MIFLFRLQLSNSGTLWWLADGVLPNEVHDTDSTADLK
jgi:hypothetical protein